MPSSSKFYAARIAARKRLSAIKPVDAPSSSPNKSNSPKKSK